jgi:hypothetical protein
MTDDGGVLENLPRSRPGQRSEKRKSRPAAKADAKRGRPTSRPAKPSATAAPRAERGADPVGGAIRVVAGLAGTGARAAGGVAREVLRRLPRP